MDETLFWRIIENARRDSGGDETLHAQMIAMLLSMKSKEDIIRFGTLYHTRVADANLPWLFVALQWICRANDMTDVSTDTWTYFRSGLVGRGRATYDAVVANSDALADVFTDLEDFLGGEGLLYAAEQGYRLKTRGKELPDDAINVRGVFDVTPAYATDDQLRGTDLPQRFPRIYRKFGAYRFLDSTT